MDRLRLVPANDDTLELLTVVDPAPLQVVAGRSNGPAAREPDVGWTMYTQTNSRCEVFLVQNGLGNVSSLGTLGPRVDIWGDEVDGSLSACQGGWVPDEADQEGARTVGGVDGVDAGRLWVGWTEGEVFAVGEDVDPDEADRFVAGGEPVADSLADHPGVQAVFRLVGDAPSVAMGRMFTDLPDLTDGDESAAGPPVAAEFGGYAWQPGDSGDRGTGIFVTVYEDAAQAEQVGAWVAEALAGVRQMVGAVTEVDGTAVVTRVPGVAAGDYSLATLGYDRYPAFG